MLKSEIVSSHSPRGFYPLPARHWFRDSPHFSNLSGADIELGDGGHARTGAPWLRACRNVHSNIVDVKEGIRKAVQGTVWTACLTSHQLAKLVQTWHGLAPYARLTPHDFLGQNQATATPPRATAAPTQSPTSGRSPSSAQPHR